MQCVVTRGTDTEARAQIVCVPLAVKMAYYVEEFSWSFEGSPRDMSTACVAGYIAVSRNYYRCVCVYVIVKINGWGSKWGAI